jgi:hypothetical protein
MGTLLGLSWPMMARAWAPHSNTYSDIVMEWLCGRTPTSDWETLGGQRRNNLPHNRGFTGAVLVCVCVCVCLLRALQLQYNTGGALFEQRSFLRLGLSEKVLSYNEQHMQTTTTTHHQPQRNNKSGPSVGPPQAHDGPSFGPPRAHDGRKLGPLHGPIMGPSLAPPWAEREGERERENTKNVKHTWSILLYNVHDHVLDHDGPKLGPRIGP